MYLSDLIGRRCVDTDGHAIGRLRDVVARVDGEAQPPVTGVLASHAGGDVFIPLDRVERLDAPVIRVHAQQYDRFRRRPGEVVLGRDVMDSQVIDLRGPGLVRVNDVLLQQEEQGWCVSAVDIGMASLLRRLLPRAWHRRDPKAHALPWSGIELLATSVPGDVVSPDHTRLARHHPADIARVADLVPTRQATEIVSSLDDDLAADTMEEMADEKQADVIEELDPERAADILEHMAPDAAADVLAELEPEVVDAVLQRMVPAEAADVHALLTYPKDTAGGLMTTDYVIAPRDLRVRDAATHLRDRLLKPEWVHDIYIVEDERERQLIGTITLRDLLLAKPDQTVGELMRPILRRVHPDTPAATVARIMSEYNLVVLPVTDEQGRLLGIVSVDDALEVILPAELRRRIPYVFR